MGGRDNIASLAAIFSGRIGRALSTALVTVTVHRMIASLRRVSAAVTFPKGVSEAADRVMEVEVSPGTVARIPRYDISFSDLPPLSEIRKLPEWPLKIICALGTRSRRFLGQEKGNKGTERDPWAVEYMEQTGSLWKFIFSQRVGREMQTACQRGMTRVIWLKRFHFRNSNPRQCQSLRSVGRTWSGDVRMDMSCLSRQLANP